MKRSLGLLTVGMVSSLFLMGCPGNSGGGGNGNVNQLGNESCTINGSYDTGSYTCTQMISGVQRTTPVVQYFSRQDFCYKITNQQNNMDMATGQVIAVNYRAQLSSQAQCGVTTNPTNPTGFEGFKSFTCQLQARKGQAVYQGEAQQFYLPKNGGTVTLVGNTVEMAKWKWFPYLRYVNLGTLTMRYTPAMGTASMDQIKMSISRVDGSTSASVTGFAGAENKIEITPRDDEEGTQILASCVSSDAVTRPEIISSEKYQCVGTEQYRGRTRNFNYTNMMNDVVNSGISITNTVFVQADGAGLVNFSQSLNNYDDSAVDVRAGLLSPTSVTIEKLGYSLKVKCQPK